MIGIIVLGNDAESLVTLLRLQELRSSLKEPILLAHKTEIIFEELSTNNIQAMVRCLTAGLQDIPAIAIEAPEPCDAFRTRHSKGDRKGRKADRWC
jgi:hypothetical protein